MQPILQSLPEGCCGPWKFLQTTLSPWPPPACPPPPPPPSPSPFPPLFPPATYLLVFCSGKFFVGVTLQNPPPSTFCVAVVPSTPQLGAFVVLCGSRVAPSQKCLRSPLQAFSSLLDFLEAWTEGSTSASRGGRRRLGVMHTQNLDSHHRDTTNIPDQIKET